VRVGSSIEITRVFAKGFGKKFDFIPGETMYL